MGVRTIARKPPKADDRAALLERAAAAAKMLREEEGALVPDAKAIRARRAELDRCLRRLAPRPLGLRRRPMAVPREGLVAKGDHEALWRLVEGAVRDAFAMHPHYLTRTGQSGALPSIVKRVVGQLIGRAHETRKGGGLGPRQSPGALPARSAGEIAPVVGEGLATALPHAGAGDA